MNISLTFDVQYYVPSSQSWVSFFLFMSPPPPFNVCRLRVMWYTVPVKQCNFFHGGSEVGSFFVLIWCSLRLRRAELPCEGGKRSGVAPGGVRSGRGRLPRPHQGAGHLLLHHLRLGVRKKTNKTKGWLHPAMSSPPPPRALFDSMIYPPSPSLW